MPIAAVPSDVAEVVAGGAVAAAAGVAGATLVWRLQDCLWQLLGQRRAQASPVGGDGRDCGGECCGDECCDGDGGEHCDCSGG